MYKERPDGPSYQTGWQAFTGLFDKERRIKPTSEPKRPEDEQDENQKQKGKH